MPENVVNGDQAEVTVADDSTDDVHFEPIVTLPLVDVSTNEEDEEELIKLRAKLYRYDSAVNPGEWKERGTGEVKLLKHKIKSTVRVVMRRDKTYKICANHFVTPWMELKPNCGSDKAWVWSVLADYADEQLKSELLAIRFANAENATAWKEAFEKAKQIVSSECEIYAGKSPSRRGESESESSSEVSYSESTESDDKVKKEEDEGSSPTKSAKDEKSEDTPKERTEGEKKETDEVSKELEKLQVKDEDKK